MKFKCQLKHLRRPFFVVSDGLWSWRADFITTGVFEGAIQKKSSPLKDANLNHLGDEVNSSGTGSGTKKSLTMKKNVTYVVSFMAISQVNEKSFY